MSTLPATLLEDVDAILASGPTYRVDGKETKGQPFSALCANLYNNTTPSGRRWRSLGSSFRHQLEQSGYRIEPGEGTQPRQRGSREVVFKQGSAR
jgi:hypothetical protein